MFSDGHTTIFISEDVYICISNPSAAVRLWRTSDTFIRAIYFVMIGMMTKTKVENKRI